MEHCAETVEQIWAAMDAQYADDGAGGPIHRKPLYERWRSAAVALVGRQDARDVLHDAIRIALAHNAFDPIRKTGPYVNGIMRRLAPAIWARRSEVALETGRDPFGKARPPLMPDEIFEEREAKWRMLAGLRLLAAGDQGCSVGLIHRLSARPIEAAILYQVYIREEGDGRVQADMGLTDTQYRLRKSRGKDWMFQLWPQIAKCEKCGACKGYGEE